MSHYTVMVVGDNPDVELEPFCEDIAVEEYVMEEVSEEDKQSFLDFYGKRDPRVKKMEFVHAYNLHGDAWNGNRWKVNEDGIWQEWSTYNPDSKWDWYTLGGRWSGLIKLKDGATGYVGSPGIFKNEVGIDQAYKKDIANWDELETYAYLIDGVWHEIGDMGWFGMNRPNMAEEEWNAEVKKIKDSIPEDALISIIDCHI